MIKVAVSNWSSKKIYMIKLLRVKQTNPVFFFFCFFDDCQHYDSIPAYVGTIDVGINQLRAVTFMYVHT